MTCFWQASHVRNFLLFFGWTLVEQILYGQLAVNLLLILLLMSGVQYQKIAVFFPYLFVIFNIFNLAILLAALRKGYPPAIYAALGLLVLFSFDFVPRFSLLLGWHMFSFTDQKALRVVLIYAVSLLYFVSNSQRVDLLRREKDAALLETLITQQQNAAHLEAKVAERTRQLHVAKELAERADQAKGEFLARVSHELRTPLHTILGYAQLLRPDIAGSPAQERLAALEAGCDHFTKLVDDLLDYARGERGGLLLQPEATFLGRELERLQAYGASLVDKRRQHFTAVFAANLPDIVLVDTQRLEQVLLILLSNAVRYTHLGRINLFARTLPAAEGKTRLRFTVEDSGRGIEPAEIERIFDPFERISDGENTGGLGLGLAIGRQIVRAMGGELQVESCLGEGSRFWFEVELELASEAEIPVAFPDLDIIGFTGPPRSILVVEDHAANRQLLEQLLSELGFAVQATGSVTETLACLADGCYDLAIFDQLLPDGLAWDILRPLHDNKATRTMPVVLLSAQPPKPPDDWGESPGFDKVLLKPVSGVEVLECIGGLLGLTWRRADASIAVEGPQAGGSAALLQGSLSAAECAELTELAAQGAVYEIEAWLARFRANRPELVEFSRKVEQCLAVFDFAGIAALRECIKPENQ